MEGGFQPFRFVLQVFDEIYLLYNVVLLSAVQQCELAVNMHTSLPLEPPARSSQSTEQSALCGAAPRSLPIWPIIVNTCQRYSLDSSSSPSLKAK